MGRVYFLRPPLLAEAFLKVSLIRVTKSNNTNKSFLSIILKLSQRVSGVLKMKLLIFALLGSGLHAQEFADVQEMMEYNVARWDLKKYWWCAIHYTMCITQAQWHILHNIPSFLLHQIPHGGSRRRRFLIKPWRLDVQVSLDALKQLIPGHWIQSWTQQGIRRRTDFWLGRAA